MFYKNVKPVDYQDIQKFANIFDFPRDDFLMKGFYHFNGGQPSYFNFIYDDGNNFIMSKIDRLLSFNNDDNENIMEAIYEIGDESGEIIPFAIDFNGNYICYVRELECDSIKLYHLDNDAFYDILTDNKDIYYPQAFFEDLLNQ